MIEINSAPLATQKISKAIFDYLVTTLERVRQPDGTGSAADFVSISVYYIAQGLDLSLLLFGVAL